MWSRKCPVGEMSVRGNVLVGKCPVGEASFGELSVRGNVHRGSFRRGSVIRGIVLGEVSVGELSAYRFTVNIAKIFKNTYFEKHLQRLFLQL